MWTSDCQAQGHSCTWTLPFYEVSIGSFSPLETACSAVILRKTSVISGQGSKKRVSPGCSLGARRGSTVINGRDLAEMHTAKAAGNCTQETMQMVIGH